jgi:hypothetical protein
MQTNVSNEKYATLNAELGVIKTSNKHVGMDLKELVRYSDITAKIAGYPRNLLIGNALHLGGKSIDELGDVLKIMDKIGECLYSVKSVNPYIVLRMSHEKTEAGRKKEFELATELRIKEYSKLIREAIGDTGFPANVKEIILHPLLASVLGTFEKRELDFVHRMMAATENEMFGVVLRKE